jgi:hypothetical protein
MKDWTPRDIANIMVIGTVCVILLTIEAGIVWRSTPSDVSESRGLLTDTVSLVIGLVAGYFIRHSDGDKKP